MAFSRQHVLYSSVGKVRRNSLQFDWIHSGTLIVSYVFRYLDDVALHHLVDALCRLSSTSMEQAQSNKVTEKSRVNFMALVRSIFNLEMFSRGFQVLDSLLHSLPRFFLLVYYCLLCFVQSKRNNTYCRSF